MENQGKEINFQRILVSDVPGMDYLHKGILYFPSVDIVSSVHLDSDGNKLISTKPYVIHLWHPSDDKILSRIRIDPLEDVILGSRITIIDDKPRAFPIKIAIMRALSRVGEFHNGLPYDLFSNNCGNFVSWAKYGRDGRDQQVREKAQYFLDKARHKIVTRIGSGI
jgi:hypothetical protein